MEVILSLFFVLVVDQENVKKRSSVRFPPLGGGRREGFLRQAFTRD
ncbi:MAG: hypothetical protein JWR09_5279 [Mucilaginibacter sp.]|nr:hypothetical protein [Mucilaginibacter sp.]